MLDQGRQGHHILQGHPVHHLDVVVSDQLGGGDRSEATVGKLTSDPSVKDLGWGGVRGSAGLAGNKLSTQTCRPVQLLHLFGVGSLQELVQVVFS